MKRAQIHLLTIFITMLLSVNAYAATESSSYTLLGSSAGASLLAGGTGTDNLALGYYAGNALSSGNSNSFVGHYAGRNTTGSYNSFLGFYAGLTNTAGISNTFVGNMAGRYNSTGSNNVLLGSYTGYNNTFGIANTFLGYRSGNYNTTGSNNTYVGSYAGYSTMGDKNVFLGYNAGYWELGSYKLYIENSGSTSPLIYGEFDNRIVGINGKLGVGTTIPSAPLHVRRADGTAKLLVEETNAAVAARTLFELRNAGNTKFAITNTDAGNTWAFTNSGTDFRISLQESGVVEMIVDNGGNLTVAGTSMATNHVNTSSRSVKHGFQEVAQDKILEKVTQLPISSWQYNEGDSGNRHIGPVAEDFQAIFGLGDGKHISTVDTDGIALAAIQGLKKEKDQELAQLTMVTDKKLAEKDKQIAQLQSELANLRELVQSLVPQDVVASID